MTYTLTPLPNTIYREADGAFIPMDPQNLDYVAYQRWVAEGNTPKPYSEVAPSERRPVPLTRFNRKP